MKPVTLIDGRQVDSSSDEWRAECEARYVFRMDDDERSHYLERVADRRGKDAARALSVAVNWMRLIDHVCNLPTKEDRNRCVAEIEGKYGKPTADRLRELVIRAWTIYRSDAAVRLGIAR